MDDLHLGDGLHGEGLVLQDVVEHVRLDGVEVHVAEPRQAVLADHVHAGAVPVRGNAPRLLLDAVPPLKPGCQGHLIHPSSSPLVRHTAYHDTTLEGASDLVALDIVAVVGT